MQKFSEYIEVLRRLHVAEPRLKRFVKRLQRREIVTHVNLGPRFAASRDPDDNLMLATAAVGKAKFLVTNDHDLLDLPPTQRRTFTFEIVTPSAFLTQVAYARS
ncbi:MAG: putative toxin-antitoxin system toxin component, PIN family [Candidatus Binatia bacterium]